jgi:ABC-2 type transport system ATP-binding protein
MLGHDPCVRRDVVRRHAGAMLTGARLYERASVRDNLEIYARLHGIPGRERDGRVTAALAATRLQDRPALRAGALSAGEKQRLLLACAQLHRPAILLLDEPTATLDSTAAAELRDRLASLARDDGVTVLLVTHHVTFAEALCDRVGIMLDGSLLAEGSPQALRERDGVLRQVEVSGWGLDERVLALVRRQPWVAEARLSPDGRRLSLARRDDGDNAPLIDLLREAGVVIDEVRRRRPSLEDALVQLARTREGDDGR